MGKGFNSLNADYFVFMIITGGVVFHFMSKYAHVSVDFTSFALFILMCLAGFFAFKTAKEIAVYLEERKVAYETLKASALYLQIAPVAFQTGVNKFSKYATYSNSMDYCR